MLPMKRNPRARMVVPTIYSPDEIARLADLERANDALVAAIQHELPEYEKGELRSAQRLVVELIENYR